MAERNPPVFDYTKKQVDALMIGVYMGAIDVNNLPTELYFATANYLKAGLYEGWGVENLSGVEFGSPDYLLLNKLRTNTYIFSGAKTYQQYQALNKAVYKGNEKLSYKVFKERALAIFEDYNLNYLKTEWETAITSASTAKQWSFAEQHKDKFPYLKYNAIIDERTSEVCRMANGITLPVDAPFFKTHVPPQHFNCRCVLEHIDKYEDVRPTSPQRLSEVKKYMDDNVQPVFKMNPGIDKIVFSPKHPYFQVEPKDRGKANRNFGLPIPKTDKERPKPAHITKEDLPIQQQKEFDALPRLKLKKPEDMQQQEKSLRQYVTEKKKLTAEYLKENGNTINADEARKLFNGYNGKNAAAVHEASSALVKNATDVLIEKGKNNLVTMYAGGAGSGKTSSIESLIPNIKENSDAIIDGNMSSFSSALSKIDKFLGKGKAVDIHYAYRDPMDAWENGVIHRMLNNPKEQGRIVPLSTFMENTTGSLETVKLLKSQFDKNPNIKITTIDNSLGKGKTQFMSEEKFKSLHYPADMRDKLLKRTKELLEEGKITKKQYDGLIQ